MIILKQIGNNLMASKSWHKFLHHLPHHLFSAAVLASVLLLVEVHTDYLHWLDSLSLRVSAPFQSNLASINSLPKADLQPLIMVIDDDYYERVFHQTSPLNRRLLADLLDSLAKQKPRLIAVDIDLSPSVSDRFDTSSRKYLDDVIKNIAKETKLVIGAPNPTETEQKWQASWTQEMCANDVSFGLSSIKSFQGVVIRHNIDEPTIGNVAFDDIQDQKVAHKAHLESVCDWAKSGELFEKSNQKQAHQQSIPITSSIFSSEYLAKRYFHLDNAHELPEVSNKVVFLGGDYTGKDNFQSPLGLYPGVFMHAAGYSSRLSPIRETSHALAWVLDIIIGVALGFLFHFMWQGIAKAKIKLTSFKDKKLSIAYKAILFQVLMVLAWTVPLIITGLFFYFSACLLSNNMWLNPGPMVFGMFLHAVLLAKVDHQEATHNPTFPWWTNTFWSIPLFIFAISVLFHHAT